MLVTKRRLNVIYRKIPLLGLILILDEGYSTRHFCSSLFAIKRDVGALSFVNAPYKNVFIIIIIIIIILLLLLLLLILLCKENFTTSPW